MPSIYSLIYQRKWFIGMCLVWMTIRVTIYFSVSTNVGSFSHNQNQGSDKRALIPSRKSGRLKHVPTFLILKEYLLELQLEYGM